ncbi:hypothetical protein APR50_04415 [Variovorax paradoxus]|jgi:hypothetical protein|uniref:hypothetical protein n=1 Tax=Variovorax TaxID=34072 RepID=UPI0006E56A8B|nr:MULTISPECIES: hypothetical protein [unclassified Variovorax]KPV10979.1 hypothetical protein APR50_04415 [Variovorax paradoxus]KPV13514.1 hypothetical protein APR49_03355 [Variovorax paradoxus]KPV24233.1 hypothetical protein APR51_04540 [Variovorax paradoxus]KPV32762.1 hypothetical protein APR48_12670 [Variovorax paradoxus]KPV36138.1 hypothetical protein APR47_12380 [Variovorax paradoxus]
MSASTKFIVALSSLPRAGMTGTGARRSGPVERAARPVLAEGAGATGLADTGGGAGDTGTALAAAVLAALGT